MAEKTNQEWIEDNNDKIDEIKAKVNNLPDYSDLKALATVTGAGENITLDGTAAELNYLIPPLPRGNNIDQHATEGTQTIDTNETISERTINGVTYSLKNGIFKFNGTATVGFYITLTNKVNLESGTYTFAPSDESGSYTGTIGKYAFTTNDGDIIDGGYCSSIVTKTLNNSYSNVVLRFYIAARCLFENYQCKINLVKGAYTVETLPDWERYTGNIPSPNPDYKQEVQVVKGTTKINTSNENVADIFDFAEHYTIGTDGLPEYAPNMNRITNMVKPINVSSYDDVNISFENSSQDTILFIYSLLNKNNELIRRVPGNESGTTVDTSDADYLYICLYDDATFEIISNIQVTQGNTTKPYKPHQGQILSLSLGDIELCKAGDYQDFLFKAVDGNDDYDSLATEIKNSLEYGNWYLHEEVKKVVLDGSNDQMISKNDNDSSNYLYYYASNDRLPNTSLLCDGLSLKALANINGGNSIDRVGIAYITNPTNKTIYFNVGYYIDTNNVTAVKDYLSLNNLKIYYILETAINTKITDITLINQLEAIYNATSYEGQTNIDGTSDGLNPLFNVKAYKSIKSILEDLGG